MSMTLSDLEGHFSFEPFLAPVPGELTLVLIGKRTWPVNSAVVWKLKDVSRSQALTYTVEVAVSQKRCNIETLLLQTTNRKSYMAYRIAQLPMTLSDLQGRWPIASRFKCDF